MKMTKVVNIYPTSPITGVNPPIRSAIKNVTKSVEEIRTCLIARAIVEEIIGGAIVRLDNTNYDKDNSHLGIYPVDENDGTPANDSNNPESDYEKAYKAALNGVDLASLPRKKRHKVMAAAEEAARKAVAGNTVDAVDPINAQESEPVEVPTEDNAADDKTEIPVDENAEANTDEAPVETLDAENINTTAE
jgi:hypothetical protein